ncbi:SGNH/GDSL hydrolase family protein [Streptomyces sp. NPDC088745]|uniref:SGNH/GDSL hydrolase family protein n=1 Tax=Streptomyces sp. NPDC088745 TaxID=3365884 RepID=UPI00381155D9
MHPSRRALLTTAALTTPATLLTIGTAAGAAVAQRPRALVGPGEPLVYGVIGDSITGRGSFASSADLAWTSLLQARLSKTWQVTRVNGVTSRDGQGLTCLATVDTVPFGCDLVVVGLGTNDCRERRDNRYVYTPKDTRSAARALFTAVAAASPGAVVVGLGVWGDRTLLWSPEDCPRPVSRVAYWDELLAECWAENGGIFVPCADLYDVPAHRLPAGRPAFGGYTTDGFHPNDAGHQALYQRVADLLRLP